MTGKEIYVTSMVASQSHEPAVMFRFGEEFVTMTIDEARDLAISLFAAAESAEQDAFMVRYALKGLGCTPAQAASLLDLFRHHRASEGLP